MRCGARAHGSSCRGTGRGARRLRPRPLVATSAPADKRRLARLENRMGLFKLLTFPVSLPIAGGTWVLQTVLDEAERRYYDEAAILEEMAQLERQFESGDIDQQAFDEQEEALLQRLLDAREYRQRKEAEQAQD